MATKPTRLVHIGAGEPVLLIHPFLLSHHVWKDVVDELAPNHEVLAVTMPGHWGGESIPVTDINVQTLSDGVERMLDYHGWDTCHLVGNSLGGWVAFELARRGRARSVTAIAPAGGWRTLSISKVLVGLRFLGLGPLIVGGRLVGSRVAKLDIVRRLILPLTSSDLDAVQTEDFETLVTAATHCAAYLPMIVSGLFSGGVRDLDKITVPVRLLLCENDAIIEPKWFATVFLNELPHHAERITLPGVGHVPMLEDPALVAGMIAENVARATERQLTA